MRKYRPKRDKTLKIACIICGVATKRAMCATLMQGEPMCWDCADRQHAKCKGGVAVPQTGTLVPVHDGRKRI